MPRPLRIVFMGSPATALPCLDYLSQSVHKIVGVVTQPDRPQGRGRHLKGCAIAERAREKDLPLFQPASLKNPPFEKIMVELQADLAIVVAYGKILPRALLELPKFKCWNVHFSLLPKYRGAAPYQWALINGEKKTGVSVIRLVEELDAGPILNQSEVVIASDDNAATLERKLAEEGAQLLRQTLQALEWGTLKERVQDESQATLAPILQKADGLIDWEQDAVALQNRIRGLNPWPGAFTFIPGPHVDKLRLKIYSARAVPIEDVVTPGTVLQANDKGFIVACGDGALSLLEVQVEGKNRMSSKEFLHGMPLPEESQL